LIDYALLTAVGGAEGFVVLCRTSEGFTDSLRESYRATLTNTTIEDTDLARLTYEGSWTVNEDVRFSGNTSSYTNEQLSVSLKFNGSVVYVYGDTVNVGLGVLALILQSLGADPLSSPRRITASSPWTSMASPSSYRATPPSSRSALSSTLPPASTRPSTPSPSQTNRARRERTLVSR
jgi:hypothetical protein